MKIQNSKKWSPYSARQACLGTALIILVSFALRYFLHPLVEPYAVFHFFIVACLAVQYFFGYKFALVSVLFSVILGEYYFVKPYGSFDVLSPKDLIISLNFALVTLTAIAFMEPLSRALFTRDLLLKVVESRHKISLYRENDRIFQAQQSSQNWSILEALLNDFDQILVIKFGASEYKVEPLFFKITKTSIPSDDVLNWQDAVYFEDKSLLDQIFQPLGSQIGAPRSFDLRFVQADGGLHACRVCVDHFNFMGKNLSILKIFN
jgi:K+-sensing histidine kinase KdpD